MATWHDLPIELVEMVFSFVPIPNLKRIGHLCKGCLDAVRRQLYTDCFQVTAQDGDTDFSHFLAFARDPLNKRYASRIQHLVLTGTHHLSIEQPSHPHAPIVRATDIPHILRLCPDLRSLQLFSVRFLGISFNGDIPSSKINTLVMDEVVPHSKQSNPQLLLDLQDHWEQLELTNCRWHFDSQPECCRDRSSMSAAVLQLYLPRTHKMCAQFAQSMPFFANIEGLRFDWVCHCASAYLEQIVGRCKRTLRVISAAIDAHRDATVVHNWPLHWLRGATSAKVFVLELHLDDADIVQYHSYARRQKRTRLLQKFMRFLPPNVEELVIYITTSTIATPTRGDDSVVNWNEFATTLLHYPALRSIVMTIEPVEWQHGRTNWNRHTVSIIRQILQTSPPIFKLSALRGETVKFVWNDAESNDDQHL